MLSTIIVLHVTQYILMMARRAAPSPNIFEADIERIVLSDCEQGIRFLEDAAQFPRMHLEAEILWESHSTSMRASVKLTV